MAALNSFPLTAITYVSILFLIPLLQVAHSQDPMIPDCLSRLLPLTACAPFVQGTAQVPAQPCCDNLNQLYVTQRGCLCLIINDTAMSAFPINRTLALQLPDLCRLQADLSVCSGVPGPPNSSTSPSSSGSQVSFGSSTNSSVASAPVVQVAPRPSIMGFGYGRSTATKLKTQDFSVVIALAAFLSAILLI